MTSAHEHLDAGASSEQPVPGETHHQHHVDPAELVPLEEHRRAVLSRIRPLEAIELDLLEAHLCVLAEDVVAGEDVPGFANSAMDGYAVIAGEVADGDELTVVGEVAAGSSQQLDVEPGRAVRIMTGAPLPPGADAVVPVELVDEHPGSIRVHTGVARWENVRAAGESVRAGDTVLSAGRRLGAADVGMLAAVGRRRVTVYPRPRVVVLSTGDELVEPGRPLGPGKIRDANSFTLTAMARETGAVAFRQQHVADERHALAEAFEGALSHADLLVTSGGVSAGRYDLVKQVLAQLGDVAFSKVGVRPGMPQAFGFIGGVPCFGLPGNPVSAAVSFELFVRPAIRRLQGRSDLNRPRVAALLADVISSPPHKVEFVRVSLDRQDGVWHARPAGAQGSGILRSLVLADGLAEIPADVTSMQAGEQVVVHVLAAPT